MSGLLHRLAARANGTAWTVRSDARLPFGAPAWREAEAVPETGLQAPLPRTPATPASPVAVSATPVMPHERPAAVAAQPASPAPLLSPAAAEPTRSRPALQQALAAHTTEVHAQLPTSKLPAPPAVQRPAMALARNTAQAAPPQPARDMHDAPSLLLPPVRAEAGQPPTAAARRPATLRATAMAQPATAQDTEVHIHIGRIDVTAVHEAPKPKARPRDRAQPVSLDAYLAKRGSTG